MKHRFLLFSCTIIFIISACNQPNKIPQKNNYPSGSLNISINDPVETLDPVKILYRNDWQVVSAIYEGLVGYTEDHDSLEALIAESWQVFDNGKRFTFKIRDSIYFHDNPCFPNGKGRLLDIDDVIYSFNRMLKKSSGNVFGGIFNGKIIGQREYYNSEREHISGLRRISENEIEIVLTDSYSTFLKLLATPSAFIIPKEAVKYYGDQFYKNPVGTGPFRLSIWNHLDEIHLSANRKYWCKSKNGVRFPLLKNIKFTLVLNSSKLLPELLKGNNDLYLTNLSILSELKTNKDFDNKFETRKNNGFPHIRFWEFSFDKNSSLYEHKNLRRAIAADYDPVVFDENSLQNFTPSKSLVPKYLLNNLDSDMDNVYAESMISENITGDVEVCSSIRTISYDSLVSKLKSRNITVNGNILASKYYHHIVNNKPEIFRVSMTPSFPDVEEYYSLFYSGSDKYVNLCNFKNNKYDKIFRLVMLENNVAKRNELCLELEKILKNEGAFIPISYSTQNIYVFPKYVKDFKMKYNIPDFRTIWIDDNYVAKKEIGS
ncbi:MAG: ABC transporter substrate-binding protein [Melioribacteraceae bacterium]|nr:ABC transporter substrate-binding protein [Melioribacteraceae bacterium]